LFALSRAKAHLTVIMRRRDLFNRDRSIDALDPNGQGHRSTNWKLPVIGWDLRSLQREELGGRIHPLAERQGLIVHHRSQEPFAGEGRVVVQMVGTINCVLLLIWHWFLPAGSGSLVVWGRM
jgi:hypothetical protein